MASEETRTDGWLRARPERVTGATPVGLQPLMLGAARQLPVRAGGLPGGASRPLVLLLHGAGGHAHQGIDLLRGLADAAGLVLLAPASRERTWDLLVNRRYGPDLGRIDRALEQTFSRYAVDPERVAVGGFSHGASYALSLGITNGDLFRHVIAFSPGFMAPAGQTGSPRVFVSHGTGDRVLPIGRCSRRIVPQLERSGCDVLYREFDGGHMIPPRSSFKPYAGLREASLYRGPRRSPRRRRESG
jgi:phospholipase/carboxylesterase